MSEFSPIYRKFSFLPHDETYYVLAFTHPSYNGLAGTRHVDYERLEFLGDSLIGFIVSKLCFKYHPEMSQGDLSVLKAQFIKSESEASYCVKLGLDKFIKVGPSLSAKIIDSKNVLEDVFESFIGAIYLDLGYDSVKKFIYEHIIPIIEDKTIDFFDDYKSVLQELVQTDRKSLEYVVINEEGPAHDKQFTVEVKIDNIVYGTGCAHSKKEAEQQAAHDALKKAQNGDL